LKVILALIKKEWHYDLRQKHQLIGLLLYTAAMVYAIFLMQNNIEPDVWNTVFWLVMLFSIINAVVKTFGKERKEEMLYYYQLVSSQHYFLAKVIYHTLLTLFLSVATFFIFLLLGNPITNAGYFVASSICGSVAMSVLFTFIGALNHKTGQSGSMNVVLGIPLMLPQLLLLARVNQIAIGEQITNPWLYYTGILGYALLIVLLGYILIDYLWRN
jgi:heme exporter protein B